VAVLFVGRHRLTSSDARARIAIAAAGLLSAGCQPTGTSPHDVTARPQVTATPAASAAVVGPILSGTVSIAGAATIPTTSFTVDAQLEEGAAQASPLPNASCAEYSNGFSSAPTASAGVGFAAPMLQTTGYHSIYVSVTMARGYKGPGVYDSVQTPSLAGIAVEGIGSPGVAWYTVFHANDQGATTLIVHPDGSGSVRIVHWDSDEVRQAPGVSQVAIDGIVTWTCRG
jgi:hypothetical protein